MRHCAYLHVTKCILQYPHKKEVRPIDQTSYILKKRLTHSARRRAHGAASVPTAGTTAAIINRRLVAATFVAECGETVSEREHHIASDCIILAVLDITGIDSAAYILLLMQQIIHFRCDCGCLVFQELIRDRCIPQPLVGIVPFTVTLCAAIRKVGIEHQAKRRIISPVKHGPVTVYGAVVLRLHGVVCHLHIVIGTKFQLHGVGVKTYPRRQVHRERAATVVKAVVVTHSIGIAQSPHR